MAERRTRRTLTPIGDELKVREIVPGRPSLVDRWRRRWPRREPPTTLRGALLLALVRLVVIAVVAGAAAALVAHFAHRRTSFGLYVVGALVLASAFLMSAGRGAYTTGRYSLEGRRQRMSLSAAYLTAGFMVLGLAILTDSLGR